MLFGGCRAPRFILQKYCIHLYMVILCIIYKSCLVTCKIGDRFLAHFSLLLHAICLNNNNTHNALMWTTLGINLLSYSQNISQCGAPYLGPSLSSCLWLWYWVLLMELCGHLCIVMTLMNRISASAWRHNIQALTWWSGVYQLQLGTSQ